ncbi:histone H2B type F-M-like protein [Cricetulus griseus]|uniref:Histone H2B type F-M-like protein n=1 Tax=Cricetulus griseus TaxID=10029 RepID=A0A061HYA2_CRIGR|nr:histone H2B type F-M-like protein [Cricetulus griseus]
MSSWSLIRHNGKCVTHLRIFGLVMAAIAGVSAMEAGEELTTVEMASVEEPIPVEEPVAVSEQASDAYEKIRRPKSATAKKRQKQLERRRRFQSMTEEERRRAARLIKRRKDSFTIYFPRVLRNIHMGFTLSQESLNILDSFVKDMFERIATEASNLARYTRRSIINSRDIQSAVYLLLPEASQFQKVPFINCRSQCLCYWCYVQEAVSCTNLFKGAAYLLF